MPISNPDISYFLKMKPHGADSYYKSIKLDSSRPKVKRFFAIAKKLTYKLVSQIYEAEALGFSKEETIKLLDVNERLYNYALENKQSIEIVIINSLKVLYPEQEIQHPFVDFNL